MIKFTDVTGLIDGELRFLRVKDVCSVLCISRQQLHRMRKAKRFICPVRLSNNVIAFRSDELLKWMNALALVDESRDS